MSSIVPESGQGGVKAPPRGDEAHLTRAEEEFIRRYLSRPESFPQEFWGAVLQKVLLDLDKIPGSQIVGLAQFLPRVADIIAPSSGESTTSTSFVDLTTVGPSLNDLSDGTYMLLFGAQCQATAPSVAVMSVSLNGAAATDADSLVTDATNTSTTRLVIADLRNNNNNAIVAKYRSSGGATCSFLRRWLVAIKYGT